MNTYSKQLTDFLQQYNYKDYPAFPNRLNAELAGVLIPIVNKDDWQIILTQRPTSMRDHAGEICFPGGKRENNEQLEQTALREAKEELGIDINETIGRISSIPLFTSDYRIVPYVAFIDHIPTQFNTIEVAAILSISVNKICRLPYIKGSPFQYQQRQILSPVFDLKQIMDSPPTTRPIHGGTAIVLYEMITIICNLREIPVPKLKNI
jgi:8-oxo-dGTP pyrophosphatase MutT (NUDIX family)